MKIYLRRLIASGLCMIGLTSCIFVYGNNIDKGFINWFQIIFFELVGLLLMYKGIEQNNEGIK